jgi:hypothetical protein
MRVGAIHEAAVLFGGPLRIKNRQDIAPTLILIIYEKVLMPNSTDR